MSIPELQSNKHQLYYQEHKISRCNFTDSCSVVQYLNTSSGAWQHTNLHRCFDVTTNNDNFTDTFAELTVSIFSCKALPGQERFVRLGKKESIWQSVLLSSEDSTPYISSNLSKTPTNFHNYPITLT